MYKHIVAVTLAAGLIIAPVPLFVHGAVGQSTQSTPAKTAGTNKSPTSNQLALRERQRKCGAEWKEAKKAGNVEKEMKWPQYWSACNKRLKASG